MTQKPATPRDSSAVWIRFKYESISIRLEAPTKGVLDPAFPWKNRSYPEIPWKLFEFSRSQIFLFVIPSSIYFRMRDLSKTVTIEQLSRKIVPGYNRAYQGGVGYQFLGKNRICVLLNLARSFCPDITWLFHIFSIHPIEKLENSQYRGCISSRFPQFETYSPNKPSKKVANPASRKSQARSRYSNFCK